MVVVVGDSSNLDPYRFIIIRPVIVRIRHIFEEKKSLKKVAKRLGFEKKNAYL
jgi:hypothetical protein